MNYYFSVDVQDVLPWNDLLRCSRGIEGTLLVDEALTFWQGYGDASLLDELLFVDG